CRAIEAQDVGRTIFGLSISAPLSMQLDSTWTIVGRQLLERGIVIAGVVAVLLLLVQFRRAALTPPAILLGLATLVIVLHDSSFIGGVRPFDGGDDGLFYESVGRWITEHIVAGDYRTALEGAEPVFFFGAPGLR